MKGFCFYLKVKLNENGFQKFKNSNLIPSSLLVVVREH